MSGTRSPSRKEPVTEALIVSHGQPSRPEEGEQHLRLLAGHVGRLLPDWKIRSATLAAPGVLEHAINACRDPHPLVFPLFMTDGWFTKTALPARLAYSGACQLPPLGTLPDLPDLTALALQRAMERRGWVPAETDILIAAHGSPNGSGAARCTYRFATALTRLLPVRDVRIGFLEQSPHLADAAADGRSQTIELPFFAAPGGHVREDVPAALDEADFQGVRLPCLGQAWFIPELISRTFRNASIRSEAA